MKFQLRVLQNLYHIYNKLYLRKNEPCTWMTFTDFEKSFNKILYAMNKFRRK